MLHLPLVIDNNFSVVASLECRAIRDGPISTVRIASRIRTLVGCI